MQRLFYSFFFLLLPFLGIAQPESFPQSDGDSRSDYKDPYPISPGSIDFDDIHFWAGKGDNRAALVIQWSEPLAKYAYVFGYRWSSHLEVSSIDMIKAVVAACRRLYGCWTDGGTYGSVVNGFGWDPAADGDFSVTLSNGQTVFPSAMGEIPADAPQLDGSLATNPTDWFEGGWYDGYWSFWVMDAGDSSMYYSQVGASSRFLSDGSVDGWMFAPELDTGSWKPWAAAPLDNEPDPSTGELSASISDIEADRSSPDYYNLQGHRVCCPTRGVYIERCGADVRKVILP